jgi:hypothetical protein
VGEQVKRTRGRFPWYGRRAACIACALALAALGSTALAQEPKAEARQDPKQKWRIDPYTKNKPDALEKAGYVSFGPFPFGQHGAKEIPSDDVEKTLPYLQIRWIETKHFRLGIDLPAWSVTEDPEVKAKVRKELERLAEKIPNVNPKTRTLDPWLRAHLFAQRCEDIYAEFLQLAGVKDEDFPADPSKVIITPGGRYMGQGPFLGMKQKYLLMLFEKEPSFLTYMTTYLGRTTHFSQRWHCKDVSAILFTTATECYQGKLKDDCNLHSEIAFNISQNLLDGYRYYSYDLPVWIREGIGHWFQRRVWPRYNSFDQNEGSPADMVMDWHWEPKVRALVTNGGKFASFPEAFSWRDFGNITANDHMAIWSRIDFMMHQGPEKWGAFINQIKGRVTKEWLPDQTDLVGASREAIQKAYGFSVLQFDEKWAEWVKATYPSQ